MPNADIKENSNEWTALSVLTKKEAVLEIGGQRVTMKPLPIVKLRALYDALTTALPGDEGFTDLKSLPDVIERRLEQILPIIFDLKLYPFLTVAFVSENFTIPVFWEIWEAFKLQNEIGRLIPLIQSLRIKGEPKAAESPILTKVN